MAVSNRNIIYDLPLKKLDKVKLSPFLGNLWLERIKNFLAVNNILVYVSDMGLLVFLIESQQKNEEGIYSEDCHDAPLSQIYAKA